MSTARLRLTCVRRFPNTQVPRCLCNPQCACLNTKIADASWRTLGAMTPPRSPPSPSIRQFRSCAVYSKAMPSTSLRPSRRSPHSVDHVRRGAPGPGSPLLSVYSGPSPPIEQPPPRAACSVFFVWSSALPLVPYVCCSDAPSGSCGCKRLWHSIALANLPPHHHSAAQQLPKLFHRRFASLLLESQPRCWH